MTLPRIHLATALLLVAPCLPAQLAGTYTIDPAGSGSRNFVSFGQASFALFKQGVRAAVAFDVAAGTYMKGFLLYPFTGSSAANLVTFRSPTKGAAIFSVAGTAIAFGSLLGVRPSWVLVDGFTFLRTGSFTPMALNIYGSDIEIRNCTFTKTNATLHGTRIEIHHCSFTGDGLPLEFASVGGSIHHNEIRLTNSRSRFATISATPSKQRVLVFDNLFTGSISGSNSYGMAIVGPMDFVHNTVVQLPRAGSASYPTLQVYARFAMIPNVSHNIIVNLHTGTLLNVKGTISGLTVNIANNLYWSVNSTRLFLSDSGWSNSLSSWQTATGLDAKSQFADPQFVNLNASPAGLKLKDGSPAAGKASGTPSYVVDDFAGTKRKTPATIGAYEGSSKTTFVTFGKGCGGTSGYVPAIGYTGALKMGSTSFAVTLSRALGGSAVRTWFVVGATRTTVPFGGACNLLASPDVVFLTGVSGTGPGNGSASLQIKLPTDPKLRGAKAHLQWGVIDAGAAGGIAFSDAATLTL